MSTDPTTFRWDPDLGVLWVGIRSYPATFHRHSMRDDIPEGNRFLLNHPSYRMETRQCHVHFENGWQLSVIWGDATYSSNTWLRTSSLTETWPFIEEPTQVEVGVLVPQVIVRPAVTHELSGRTVEMPERQTHLWGDPLGYVDVIDFHRLADMVRMLPNQCELPPGDWESVEGFCDLLITAGLERTL